jgi:hypothetical protein
MSTRVFYLHSGAKIRQFTFLIPHTVTHHLHAYFNVFTLIASVKFQNDFCLKLHLNYSWFPNFKPSFPKTGIHVHSTLLHYSCDELYTTCIVDSVQWNYTNHVTVTPVHRHVVTWDWRNRSTDTVITLSDSAEVPYEMTHTKGTLLSQAQLITNLLEIYGTSIRGI